MPVTNLQFPAAAAFVISVLSVGTTVVVVKDVSARMNPGRVRKKLGPLAAGSQVSPSSPRVGSKYWLRKTRLATIPSPPVSERGVVRCVLSAENSALSGATMLASTLAAD